jgi:L-iditol 2-dehydrogenase
MSIRSVALYGQHDLRPFELTAPALETGGIRMRVALCGICGSDQRQYFGGPSPRYTLPAVLGHEFAGEITEVGSQVEGFAVGDRVTVAPVIPCLNCEACRRGADNLCERGLVIGVNYPGAMAEQFYVPPRMVAAGGLAHIPSGASLEAAALTELLACCWHGLRQVNPRPGEDVLVIGEGPIAATFIQLLRLMGVGRITVTGLNPFRLKQTAALGADAMLQTDQTPLRDYAASQHYSPDLAIVAAPAVEDASVALDILRTGGNLLLFSGYPHGTRLDLDLYKFHYAEKHIHGSIDATIADFHHAVRLLPQVRLPQLISHRFPLENAVEAFQAARTVESMKVVLTMPSGS